MLHFIRERAQGWIAWAIIMLLIIPFALWGINEYFGGGGIASVAIVDGKEIPVGEYQQALSQQRQRLRSMLGEGANTAQFDERLKRDVINGLIEDQLLYLTALDRGYRVGDGLLISQIHSFESFQVDGQFSQEAYERQLKVQGESPASFERRLRHILTVNQVTSGLNTSGFATEQEIARYVGLQEQHRSVGFMQIPVARFLSEVQATQEEVAKYYDTNKSRFMTPEQISLEYIELDIKALQSKIEDPSEADIKAMYEEQIAQFSTPEQRHVRHVLIEVPRSADETKVSEAKAKIETLAARIKGGEDFAKVAKEASQDTGSAKSGGDLGYFQKGSMDPDFDSAAFALKKGEVSQPVRTSFGFHLIKVEEIKAGAQKPFTEVRAKLAGDYKQVKAERQYYEKAETLANAVYESPDTLSAAADALGLVVKSTGFFTAERGDSIAANEKIRSAAFSDDVLHQGLNSEPIEVSPQHVIVVRVKEHKAATQRSLDEVKDDIGSRVRREKAQQLVQTRGHDIEQKIAKGESAAAVAKALGFAWTAPQSVDRKSTSLDPAVVKAAFRQQVTTKGQPAVGGIALVNGDYAVFTVADIKLGDPSALDAEKKLNFQRTLAGSHSNIEYAAYLEQLKKEASVIIKEDQL